MPVSYNLLTNSTASVTGDYVTVLEGGLYIAEAEGTWGGATVTLQRQGAQKQDNISITDDFGATISFSADGYKVIPIATAEKIRATMSTSGTTSLSATLKRVG